MTLVKSNNAAIYIEKKLIVKDLPYRVAVKDTFIIRNRASGLNYADIHGKYQLHEPGILGLKK